VPSLDPALSLASAYVKAYQAELSSVVATEKYSQQIASRVPALPPVLPRTRLLVSEIFFLYLDGYDWMTVRDVQTVDGKPVADSGRVRAALAAPDRFETAVRLKRENSRFNIGSTVRTFNEPTFGLLVLDERNRHRVQFKRQEVDGEGATTLVTFEFEEVVGPSLVREIDGDDVFASGTLTIEAGTGRVLGTTLRVEPGGVRMTLSTRYERDAALNMLVPVRFQERYVNGLSPEESRSRIRSFYEEIVCESRYSQFRRFEVSSRIK
jgi:hypothetical protein